MKYPTKLFCFVYSHPATLAGANMAVNITIEAQAQFYGDGEVRTIDIVKTESMGVEIPVTFFQLMMWDVWEKMEEVALAHAKKKFTLSPSNT